MSQFMRASRSSKAIVVAWIALFAIPLLGGPLRAAPEITIPKPLTLAWMKRALKLHGASYVVQALDKQQRYEDFVEQIGKGKSDWIALAPQIAEATDAGYTEMLIGSLAYALARNPKAVVSILAPKTVAVSPGQVCGANFMGDLMKDYPAYIKRARRAVNGVNDARLAKQKKKCLAELERIAKETRASQP
jgi:hypothetical protein